MVFPEAGLVLGIGGLFLGATFAFLLANIYTSSARLEITPGAATADSGHLNETVLRLTNAVLSRKTLSAIINDPKLQLYRSELQTMPLEDVIEEMKRDTSVRIVALPGHPAMPASAFEVAFSYPEQHTAQRTVRAIVDAYMTELQGKLTAASQLPPSGSLIVLAEATGPVSPVYPNRKVVMFGAFAVGVLLASIWRIIQRSGFIAKRFAVVALTFGFAGLLAAIAANRLQILPYAYRSTATLRVSGGEAAPLLAEAFSRASLASVINDPRLRLYSGELRTEPLEDVIAEMKSHLIVAQPGSGDAGVFSLSFDYPDRFKTQQTVSAIVDRLVEKNADTRFPPAVLRVLDAASLPVQPTKPKRLKIAATGGIAGVIAAALIVLIRRRWKSEGDFPRDMATGSIV